jgi:hypothetical protein
MKTISKLLLIAFSLSLSQVYGQTGGRNMRMFPINTPTGWTKRCPKCGACEGGISRNISFVNMSSISQTITITTSNITLGFISCGDTSVAGNWVSSGAGDCRSFQYKHPELVTDQFVLGPNQEATRYFGVQCRLRKSGVTDCGTAPIENGLVTWDMDWNGISIAQASHSINIAEDRGAVVATVQAGTSSGCAEFGNDTKYNLPVNGGKPF